jgi:hypothetical protein
MGKPGSCSYREFGRGPEPLIYKTPGPSLAWIQQLFSLRLEEAYISSFPSRCLYFLLRTGNPTATMEVLSYQPHSRKYSPFPQGELLPTSKFLASSSSSPTWRQSSISSWNKLSDGVSQLPGI